MRHPIADFTQHPAHLLVVLAHRLWRETIIGHKLIALLDAFRHLELTHPLRALGQPCGGPGIGPAHVAAHLFQIVLQLASIPCDRGAFLLQLADSVGARRIATRRQ